MQREALIRSLRRYARTRALSFEVDETAGKGSHYRIKLDGITTTIKSGDIGPFLVKAICKQLHVNPADL